MNPLSDELWNQAESYEQFRAEARHNQEVLDGVYASPAFEREDIDLLTRLPALRILAIGEDWCPDVYHTLPAWARVAESLDGWMLRILRRDGDSGIMDYFLWRNAARRIPVFAFYDSRNYLQVWWSGRSAEAQVYMDGLLAGKAFGELDAGEKARIGGLLDAGYRERFRRANFVEILSLLRAFFHI
jgi:hypothetical protein